MCVGVNEVVFPDCAASFLIVCVGVRSCMVEESGTLESQLEATKVTGVLTLCTHARDDCQSYR